MEIKISTFGYKYNILITFILLKTKQRLLTAPHFRFFPSMIGYEPEIASG